MGDISVYFDKQEFACNCGLNHQFDMAENLLSILDEARNFFCEPIYVNSGFRCAEYNAKINGAPHSYHMIGMAADIRADGKTPQEIYEYFTNKYPDIYGFIKYSTFVHVDVRTPGKYHVIKS